MNPSTSFAIAAALLRQGSGAARLGRAISVVALGLLLAQAQFGSPTLPWPGFVVGTSVVLLGALGEYLAIRVGFDAALLEGLAAREPAGALDAFDRSMQSLELMPPAKAGRPAEARCAGALRLLRLQLIVLGLQIGAAILGSAWLLWIRALP